jgi:hypothetical protein
MSDMKQKKLANNVKSSLRTRKLERQKFERNCLRGAAKPMSPFEVRMLNIDSMAKLKENAGRVFATMLELASSGHSLKSITELLGIRAGVLAALLKRYPKLKAQFDEAKKVKTDDARMLEFLLS